MSIHETSLMALAYFLSLWRKCFQLIVYHVFPLRELEPLLILLVELDLIFLHFFPFLPLPKGRAVYTHFQIR